MKDNVPILEKDGEDWVLIVSRAGAVRIKDRELACMVWNAATWAYNNGRDEKLEEIRHVLQIE